MAACVLKDTIRTCRGAEGQQRWGISTVSLPDRQSSSSTRPQHTVIAIHLQLTHPQPQPPRPHIFILFFKIFFIGRERESHNKKYLVLSSFGSFLDLPGYMVFAVCSKCVYVCEGRWVGRGYSKADMSKMQIIHNHRILCTHLYK